MSKNIFWFYVARLFYFPVFWLAILFIYLTEYRGLSGGTALLLVGLQEFLLIFLEIPTGAVADKWSRKLSCAIGNILIFFPLAVLPWANNVWQFAFIFIIKALGRALTSGADKSLLYDSLVDLGRTSEYRQIITRSFALAFFFAGVSIFVGGIFVKLGHIEWSFWAPLPFAIISSMAFLKMKEPEVTKKARIIQESNYLKHITESLKFTFQSKRFVALLMFLATADALGVQLKWFYTPVFNAVQMDIAAIGGVTAILYLVKSFASGTVEKLSKKYADLPTVRWSAGIIALGFTLMAGWLNVWVVLLMFGVILIADSAMIVSADDLLHSQISSYHRATVMSAINLVSSIVATGSLAVFGYLQTYSNVSVALLSLAAIFALTWVVAERYQMVKS